jgi:hypothetical protein
MGVDYSASAVFGFKVSGEQVDWIENNTKLKCFTAGNSYDGDTQYMVGIGTTIRNFGWDRSLKAPSEEERRELAELALKLKADAPTWHIGFHVF